MLFQNANVGFVVFFLKRQMSKRKFQKANLPFEICLLYLFENFKTQISKRKFQNANFKRQISKGKFTIKIVKCGFSTKTNLCFQPNPNLPFGTTNVGFLKRKSTFIKGKCVFCKKQICVCIRQMCVL